MELSDAEYAVVQEGVEAFRVALRGNVSVVLVAKRTLKHDAELGPRDVALAMTATLGRMAGVMLQREVALRWFTRALDNDPGFQFGEEDV